MLLFFAVVILSTTLLASDDQFIIENKTHAKHITRAYKKCLKQIKDSELTDDQKDDVFFIQSTLQKLNSYQFLFWGIFNNDYSTMQGAKSSDSSESRDTGDEQHKKEEENRYNRMFLMKHAPLFNIPFIDKNSNGLLTRGRLSLTMFQNKFHKLITRLKDSLEYSSTEHIPYKNNNLFFFLNDEQNDSFYFLPHPIANRILATFHYLERQNITRINVPVKIIFFDDIAHASEVINAFNQCRMMINTSKQGEIALSEIVFILQRLNTLLFLQNTDPDTRKKYFLSFSQEQRETLFDNMYIFKQQHLDENIPDALLEHCATLSRWILYKNNWYQEDLPVRDNHFFTYKYYHENRESIYFNVYPVADSIIHAYQLLFKRALSTNRQDILLLLRSFIMDKQYTNDEKEMVEMKRKEIQAKIDTLFNSLSFLRK